ncbi:MAG: Flp pilus assembly protein CpaB [Pseudomonadota bacterium]|nr:Flp pilus assembly protein CpaB [Pseudomonadota bacterium]
MRARPILLLLVSIGVAGIAAYAANNWMLKRLAGQGSATDLDGVVAAAADIPFGTKMDSTHIKMVSLPPEAIPQGSFSSPEDVIGRVAAFTIYKGEILVAGRVVEHVGGSALAAVVEEGKRAMTVRVNDVVGVAGFLLPGNRVDLIATKRKRGSQAVESQTLLQNLKVLAVDQTASPDKNEPVIVRAVTLEADPVEAEEIVRATEEGKVQLTLRNPLDGTRRELPQPEPPPTETMLMAEKVEPEPPVELRRIVVIRGTDISSTTLDK